MPRVCSALRTLRGPSTRASSTPLSTYVVARVLTVGALMLAGAGACGGPARITLSLEPARDQTGAPLDTSALQSLTIHLRHNDRALEPRAIGLNRNAQVQLDPIEVEEPGRLLVDVWACTTPIPCRRPDIAFRSCTIDPVQVDLGADIGIALPMVPGDDPRLVVCDVIP